MASSPVVTEPVSLIAGNAMPGMIVGITLMKLPVETMTLHALYSSISVIMLSLVQ